MPHHRIVVIRQPQRLAEPHLQGAIHHDLVVLLPDGTAGHDHRRPAQTAQFIADQEKAEGLAVAIALDILEGKGRGLRHAGHRPDAILDILGDTRGGGKGTGSVLLHHPEISGGGVQHRGGIGKEALVDAAHAHHHAQQQAKAEAGLKKTAPVMADIAQRQIH